MLQAADDAPLVPMTVARVKVMMSGWKSGCIAAVVVFAIAAFIVVVLHPGGFEGQVGYFFALLRREYCAPHFSPTVSLVG